MNRLLVGITLAAVGILLAPALTLAATETYKIDADHSHVGFSVRHFVSKMPGRFASYEGTIVLDPENLSTAEIQVIIDINSIDTGHADRDKHLLSADFFDAANHPQMTFKSTSVSPQGKSKALVKGELTIRGVTQEVELEAEVLGFSKDLWGGYRGGFEASTEIDRQDYGISWSKVVEGGGLVLGNEVSILLNIEGVRQAAEGDGSEKD